MDLILKVVLWIVVACCAFWLLSRILESWAGWSSPRWERIERERKEAREARFMQSIPEIIQRYELQSISYRTYVDFGSDPERDTLVIYLEPEHFCEAVIKFRPELIRERHITTFDEGPYGTLEFSAGDHAVVRTAGTTRSLASNGVMDKLSNLYEVGEGYVHRLRKIAAE